MRVKPLQIHWHDKLAILSAHFEPGTKGRFATAGADCNVRLWRVVKDKEKDTIQIEYLSSLNRHTAPVNAVRFSPKDECLASAGDDGNIILWRPSENKDAGAKFGESEDEAEKENWRVQSVMRGSLSDIYDLAWSPCGKYIISGSVDNTARIWNVKDAKCIHVITDHLHYVQGVAWDPLGEYVATQSSDRSVHIYAFKLDKNGRVVVTSLGKSTKLDLVKLRSTPTAIAGSTSGDASKDDGESSDQNIANDTKRADTAETTTTNIASTTTIPATTSVASSRTPKTFRLYHDETLNSFFRRLSFTPDGSMLIAPSGQYRAPVPKLATSSDDASQPPQAAVSTSTATSATAAELEVRNTAYIYCRGGFNKGPVAHLPGHKRPSIAIKCNPVLFTLREQLLPVQSSTAKTPASTSTLASSRKIPAMFDLGYRVVYAVATQDSILVYDTQQSAALVVVSHLHYSTFTDMAWSTDGCTLILTSTDGFCSIISFEEGELGEIYTPPPKPVGNDNGDKEEKCGADMDASETSTGGVLQKMTGLSLSEKTKKALKTTASSKEGKAAAKPSTKRFFSKTQTTLSGAKGLKASASAVDASPATSSSSSSSSPVVTATAVQRSSSGSNTRPMDEDTPMSGDGASLEPQPKKRRIQPTFVSALAGSSDSLSSASSSPAGSSSASASTPGTPQTASSSTLPSAALSGLAISSNAGPTGQPKKKRIQPIFVSALPGQ